MGQRNAEQRDGCHGDKGERGGGGTMPRDDVREYMEPAGARSGGAGMAGIAVGGWCLYDGALLGLARLAG